MFTQLQHSCLQQRKVCTTKGQLGVYQGKAQGQCIRRASPISPVLQNSMTKDVFTQLQKISLQQSKIRTLKGKLAVYQDVANKQAETFAELQLIKRVPVAYRHCLAECMRRYVARLLGPALASAWSTS